MMKFGKSQLSKKNVVKRTRPKFLRAFFENFVKSDFVKSDFVKSDFRVASRMLRTSPVWLFICWLFLTPHFDFRTDNGKEILSMNEVINFLLRSSKPLLDEMELGAMLQMDDHEWQNFVDEVRGMIVTYPGMVCHGADCVPFYSFVFFIFISALTQINYLDIWQVKQ